MSRIPPVKISEVNCFPIRQRGTLIGFASCIWNDSLHIGSIAIHVDTQGEAGRIRLVYPVEKIKNGQEVKVVYPIDAVSSEAIRSAVQTSWDESMGARGK